MIDKMIIYISGPMTGVEDHNFPAFFEAEKRLVEIFPEAEIVNPARIDVDEDNLGKEWAWYIRRDIGQLMRCTHMALLPRWRKSRGARLEVHVGSELSMGIMQLIDGEVSPLEETALSEATRLVYGDRGGTYGHPFQDYSKTAALWSVILGKKVTPEQAILCMMAVKISREINLPKRDNRVDMAGYAECLNRVNELPDGERERMLKEIGLWG